MTPDPEDVIALDEEFEFEKAPVDLGPDERDMDLMDGSWEADYYAGRRKTRDWNTIGAAIAIVVLAALLIPMLLAFFD